MLNNQKLNRVFTTIILITTVIAISPRASAAGGALKLRSAVTHSMNAYCAKSTPADCIAYQQDAWQCYYEGLDATRIFGAVKTFERQGYSPEHAATMIQEDGDRHGAQNIAYAAAYVIAHHKTTDAWLFARAVQQKCLSGVAR